LPTHALRALIESNAPHRPYCGPEKNQARIRPQSQALAEPFLQLNPPSHAAWLVFDIDRAGAANAWVDASLPPPTYVATNPANGHAHIGYALSSPVCTTAHARLKPLRYLAVIQYAYGQQLGADVAFGGLLAKNPLHPRWLLWEPANAQRYELGLLADYVELPERLPSRRQQESRGYSRNCDLFADLGAWAYGAVRRYWCPGGEAAWRNAVWAQAERLNTFGTPLSASEVAGIARSVARWTWRHMTPAGFSARQSAVGRLGGIASGQARLAASQDLRQRTLELAADGLGYTRIAELLQVPRSNVRRWVADGR